ncbi:hypothetical protein ALC62_03928 [Cyphomyrmex costatus]|uniref:Uncharacterized protein n=1 Tax=Cyphomyrmex costatus TaxID=456900 RepID=A0A195CWS9_9HYME|nr:hypothetical protein ALC62_03928 [Cyphomyrmex costatus]
MAGVEKKRSLARRTLCLSTWPLQKGLAAVGRGGNSRRPSQTRVDDSFLSGLEPVGAVWFYRGCYYCAMPSVPPPLRESPDLERETAARFSRHILFAMQRRALRSVQREKNVESCGFHLAIVVTGESGL